MENLVFFNIKSRECAAVLHGWDAAIRVGVCEFVSFIG